MTCGRQKRPSTRYKGEEPRGKMGRTRLGFPRQSLRAFRMDTPPGITQDPTQELRSLHMRAPRFDGLPEESAAGAPTIAGAVQKEGGGASGGIAFRPHQGYRRDSGFAGWRSA